MTRYVIGWISVMAMLTGFRTNIPVSYRKVSHVSRRSFTGIVSLPLRCGRSVGEAAAGLGQEHVIEAGPAGSDRARLDALLAERAHDLRDGGLADVDVEPKRVVDRLARTHEGLFAENLRRLLHVGRRRHTRGPRCGQVHDDDVAGD